MHGWQVCTIDNDMPGFNIGLSYLVSKWTVPRNIELHRFVCVDVVGHENFVSCGLTQVVTAEEVILVNTRLCGRRRHGFQCLVGSDMV